MMSKIHWLVILSSMAIFFAGCATEEVVETHEHYSVQPNVQAAPPVHSSSNVHMQPVHQATPQTSSPNTPAWINEVIEAEGNGAPPPQYAGQPGRAKLMALRAAELDAKRNLLERVLGLQMDSSTTVRDFVAESDVINAQTSGIIRNAWVTGKHYDPMEGIATARVKLKLYDVWMYMKTTTTYSR